MKNKILKSFRETPELFYIRHIVLNPTLFQENSKVDIKFDDLVQDDKTLNEFLMYKNLYYKNMQSVDHKYNMTKNVFWDKCGFSDFLKEKLL